MEYVESRFSRAIEKGERISASRLNRRERGIWQRRFWAHLVTGQDDYNRHIDYIRLESGQAWTRTACNRLAAFKFPSIRGKRDLSCGLGFIREVLKLRAMSNVEYASLLKNVDITV